jgi:uncharacterized protein with ATP-grasp and redox domains
MSHFCLLSNPESYTPIDWDLISDQQARAYWLNHFLNHFNEVLNHALARYGRTAGKQVMLARQQFAQLIQQLIDNPGSLPGGKLNIIELCRQREKALRANRLNDPFSAIKTRENASASKLYPQVVKKARAMGGKDKWLSLIQGIFAGNIFDLGSAATMHLANQPTDFFAQISNVKPRPWMVDDFDSLLASLPAQPPTKWSKAVIFIDNAGADFILGVMPLARELVMYGTKVVLAANELPSLNDMTADETDAIVRTLAASDDDLAAMVSAGMFEVVSTGTDIPLIDFSEVSDELNAAASDADLVVLEGMGRAVESNFNVKLKVDTLQVALLKDQAVAKTIGAQLYDCVCKFTPAPATAQGQ